MFNKHDKILMWAFSAATALLMIMYYMVFGEEMKTFLFMGIVIIILEISIFYFLHRTSGKSFVTLNSSTKKKPIQNDPHNYQNRQNTHISKSHKIQPNIKKATINNKQSKQWTIIDISSHVDMTMKDVLLFAKKYSSISFNNLGYRSKINNDKALDLIKELRQHQVDEAKKEVEKVIPKKKNTILKPISMNKLANMLNI